MSRLQQQHQAWKEAGNASLPELTSIQLRKANQKMRVLFPEEEQIGPQGESVWPQIRDASVLTFLLSMEDGH